MKYNEDIIFDRREDAEYVLNQMKEKIAQNGKVYTYDYYDLAGVIYFREANSKTFGWTNLDTATIEEAKGGYALNLPDPIELKP